MRCHAANLPQELPTYLLLALYRMAQELANNIVKHAHATEASLSISADGETIELRAQDNGVGFKTDLPDKAKGMGWQTLHDRVHLLNGTLELQNTPGTCVTIRLPLPAHPGPATS